jgi:hypothetical protein
MRKQNIISCIVYLIAAITLGASAFALAMHGIWGRQNFLVGMVFLFPIVVFSGALLCLFHLPSGRIVCGIALIAFGTFYISGIASIIPNALLNFLALSLIYFVALAFSLFYPTRRKFGVSIFLAILAINAIGIFLWK